MVKNCPYCGEEQTALKNHVRLASGDGHGPSGQYPDDFEQGSSQDDNDDDPGGAAAAPTPGGGGTLTVEAVEETEEPQDLPEFDEEPEEPEESIIALPESELNEMLRSAASTASEAVSGGDKSEESTSADEEDTSVETPSLDADAVAEKAEKEGWGLGAFIALFVLALLAGVAWGAIKNAAENGRQQAQELTFGNDPSIPGV